MNFEIGDSIIKYEYKQNLKLCKQFYDEYHRMPKSQEKYNGWNIGHFIYKIIFRNKDKIKDLEEIFQCNLFY